MPFQITRIASLRAQDARAYENDPRPIGNDAASNTQAPQTKRQARKRKAREDAPHSSQHAKDGTSSTLPPARRPWLSDDDVSDASHYSAPTRASVSSASRREPRMGRENVGMATTSSVAATENADDSDTDGLYFYVQINPHAHRFPTDTAIAPEMSAIEPARQGSEGPLDTAYNRLFTELNLTPVQKRTMLETVEADFGPPMALMLDIDPKMFEVQGKPYADRASVLLGRYLRHRVLSQHEGFEAFINCFRHFCTPRAALKPLAESAAHAQLAPRALEYLMQQLNLDTAQKATYASFKNTSDKAPVPHAGYADEQTALSRLDDTYPALDELFREHEDIRNIVAKSSLLTRTVLAKPSRCEAVLKNARYLAIIREAPITLHEFLHLDTLPVFDADADAAPSVQGPSASVASTLPASRDRTASLQVASETSADRRASSELHDVVGTTDSGVLRAAQKDGATPPLTHARRLSDALAPEAQSTPERAKTASPRADVPNVPTSRPASPAAPSTSVAPRQASLVAVLEGIAPSSRMADAIQNLNDPRLSLLGSPKMFAAVHDASESLNAARAGNFFGRLRREVDVYERHVQAALVDREELIEQYTQDLLGAERHQTEHQYDVETAARQLFTHKRTIDLALQRGVESQRISQAAVQRIAQADAAIAQATLDKAKAVQEVEAAHLDSQSARQAYLQARRGAHQASVDGKTALNRKAEATERVRTIGAQLATLAVLSQED